MILELFEINFERLLSEKSIMVGLDVGDKTIGISVSDARLKIASGVTTLIRKGSDVQKLLGILSSYKVGLFVVGWPIQMNGIAGSQCEKVQNFIEELETQTSVPIVKWDERFSTRVVDSVLIAANVSRKRRKQYVDKIAAVYILQGALDYFENRR